ncbi:MAG TPA: AIR synthase-related protein, partial [Candidatus Dormibacteraeota bacterium]|nr:AIR synthase-related protein [Candidatus Dormibacteraeota bacterium]
TGGNVSFYNETLGKSIYPTPVIGMLGILNDPSRGLKIAFRNPGDVILLLDGAGPFEWGNQPNLPHSERSAESSKDRSASFAREFSSSEYSKIIATIVAGEPPAIDLAAEKRLIDCLVALASEGVLESAHDVSDGGLAVAIAESCFASFSLAPASAGGGLGANVKLEDPAPAEFTLFGERGARAIVSLAPENLAALLAIARQYGVAACEIGKVTRGDVFRIGHKGRAVIESAVEPLRDAWANSLERMVTGK